jgi:hypothetical protein
LPCVGQLSLQGLDFRSQGLAFSLEDLVGLDKVRDLLFQAFQQQLLALASVPSRLSIHGQPAHPSRAAVAIVVDRVRFCSVFFIRHAVVIASFLCSGRVGWLVLVHCRQN